MELPKRIMIVEDEVITQRYLKDILGQYEMDIVECYDNAKDALTNVRTNEYDMILMDINIKGTMDGIQLAREILRKYTMPIVFITAHNDEDTFQEVLELSPYGFISKPFSGKDVEVAIQLAYRRYLTNKKTVSVEENGVINSKKIVISEQYVYSTVEDKLYENGNLVKLNFKQNKLLAMLSKNLNNIVDYDTIILDVWGDEIISDSALRTLVYTVRKILPELPIVSHSKIGYSLHSE